MKLVSDTLLDVFQFLQRSDLEKLCYVRKQVRATVEHCLKRVCLRKILSACIYFHADLETFEVTAKIDEGNVRSVNCPSVEKAVEHLVLLMTSAFVEDVSFLAVTLDKLVVDCFEKSAQTTLVETLRMVDCYLSLADPSLILRLIRSFDGCRRHIIKGTPSRTLLSDSYLSGLSLLGVSFFQYGGYTAADNKITESGIFGFFNVHLSRHWRSGTLKLYCLTNCAEISARVIAALRLMDQAPAENINILLSPLSRADVERHGFRLAHTDIDLSFASSTLYCYIMDHPAFTATLTYRTIFRSLEIVVNQ